MGPVSAPPLGLGSAPCSAWRAEDGREPPRVVAAHRVERARPAGEQLLHARTVEDLPRGVVRLPAHEFADLAERGFEGVVASRTQAAAQLPADLAHEAARNVLVRDIREL